MIIQNLETLHVRLASPRSSTGFLAAKVMRNMPSIATVICSGVQSTSAC